MPSSSNFNIGRIARANSCFSSCASSLRTFENLDLLFQELLMLKVCLLMLRHQPLSKNSRRINHHIFCTQHQQLVHMNYRIRSTYNLSCGASLWN